MKRKMWNRILSIFIAAALMVSALPMNAVAEGNETFVEEVDVTPATTEEAQPEESGGSEENYLESSNVEVQEVEENKEETAETTEVTETTEGTEETGADSSAEEVSEETTAQSEEESQATEAMGVESVEILLYSVDSLNSLNALVALANNTNNASVSLDENTNKITVDVGGLILLSNTDVDFSGYTIYLSTLSGGYADLTQTITIEEKSTDENGVETTTSQDYLFQGLGSETNPFSGTLESQDGSYGVILNVPFFRNVDVSKITFTNFSTLKMKQKGNNTSAMLAANVSGSSGENWKSLEMEVGKESVTVGGTTTDYLPTALIATMAQNASLSLGTVTYNDGAAVSSVSANAGLLCNTMNAGSTLSVDSLTVGGAVTVTATSGSAGGLVGLMNSGASLTVSAANDTAVTIGSDFTITGPNAGGLIGSGENVKLGGAKVTVDGATVKGSTAAGGLIGSYTCAVEGGFASYDGADTSTPKVNNVTLETTANDKYAGGLFGVLDLRSDFTISNASVTSTIAGSKAYYGGLVGQVKGNSADSLCALTIGGTSNPSTTTNVNLNGYAGAVAVVGDTSRPVYVKIEGEFTPTFVGANLLTKDTYFGGVATYLKPASVLELTANVAIACGNIAETNGYGGGVLGKAERGSTLCLSGTTDLSGTKFKANYINEYTGQIVGTQESALIYAKPDWTLIRQSTAQELDDIGTYGQVIRLGGNMGMGTPSDTSGLSANLISQNANTHKTEFLESAKLTLTDNTFTVTSADQLALLAIEEQTKCAFQIYSTGEDYYLKSNQNITLDDNISLAHTGITGLQRDNGVCAEYGGTLDAQSRTLTIAAGEIYGYRGDTNTQATDATSGSGQIHGHTQVGFFSTANATVTDLTVDGVMNLRFRTKTTDTSTTYLAGGLAANNTAASRYTNVTTSVNIQYQGAASGFIGGLVGYGSALTFTNCTGSATINAGSSSVYAGGLIGQYTGATLPVSGTTLSGSMEANGATHARLGGLVSRIANVSGSNYNDVTVTLTDITVNGQTITGTGMTGSTVNNVTVPASCGGLLGYEWNNASVTFGEKNANPSNGLTVTGNSAVTVNGTTETAGLVYAATGYWQVNDIKLQNFSVTSGSGDLGLLICRGWRKDIPANSSTPTKPYLLYVEETGYQAYQIGNVSVSNTGGNFDEWVVYTCEKTETITNNGNSVISIATADGDRVEGERVGVDPAGTNCTSYQNRTEYGKRAAANPNARYYYDLDVIREKATTTNSKLDTPGELVLWAVWRYAEKTGGVVSNIANYFSTSDIGGASMTGDGNPIDLTGYAYYPITVDGFNLSITNINVKFANQEIETAESKTEASLDSLNRTTVGTTESHTQHYLLHSGLLLNYQNSSSGSDVTMTVSNVTFQGTIGKGPGPNGGSGALICGQLGGYTHATSPKYAKLDIQSVKLDDVSINADKTSADTDYAPLLVNRVGSYSSLSAQNVTASGYDGVTSTNNPAATSLIGHVGGENATNITLAFSNGIALNGKKENSIFSHATLLESFQYQSGGSGYYRFYEGDTFTYGREISESVENEDLQLWYSRRDPEDQLVEVTDGSTKDFTDYLPYVCKPYTDGTDKYHELEVNLASPDLTVGCGTYDDPYIISSPGQLMRAADFINGNSPQNGWKVNKVDNAAIIKTNEEDNHSTFEAGTSNWDRADMRTYMRSAYYQIKEDLSGDLTLKSFAGFGSVDYPFVGVFDGNGKTIIIENAGSGFINVSYGSVVQNLTIQYTESKTLTDKRPAGETGDNSKKVYADSYFGGIIGTVLGGDSLIDNVTVTFSQGFTITTSYDLQFQCAGGFVGLIQGGGVVFRNMGDTTRNPGYTGTNSTYYVDKYIGRVLDGYAINEVTDSGTTASVTFAAGTGKNYSIPNISTSDTIAKITWNDGTISIGNAQQMMILTDIINSGAASNGSAKAYSSGARTRNADYSKIGNVSAEGFNAAFDASRTDDTLPGTGNFPYLIKKYAGNADGFWTACTTGVSVTFAQDASIDLSPYGNGYRGIGGRYQCNASQKLDNSKNTVGDLTLNTPKITTVTGNNVSLHVSNDIKEYRADNFYANAVGGLFNVLRHEGANITDVNVCGTVKVYSDFGKTTDVEADYLKRAPVGGVIGRDYCLNNSYQTLNLTKVSFGTDTVDPRSIVYGECVTGGLIGSSGSQASFVFGAAANNYSMLHFTNCSYQNVTVTGGMCAGGFVGAAVNNRESYIKSESYENHPTRKLEIEWTEEQVTLGTASTFQMLFNRSDDSANGIGGLIGFTSVNFSIKGKQGSNPVLKNVNVYGSMGTSKKGRVGALVGFVSNNGNTKPYAIQNISVMDCNIGKPTDNDDNAGGIVGTWYSTGPISLENCTITGTTLKSRTSGGVLGYGSRGTVYAKNIQLSNITLKYVANTVGGLGGEVSNTFYGQNVLMQNMTYEKPTNSGRFFGTGTNARLIGVTIQQPTGQDLPKWEVYYKTYPSDYGTSNYFVYAGYNSSGTITTASEITTKPSQAVPGITDGLYGDTVNPTTVSDATITEPPAGSTKKVTYYQNLSATTINVKDLVFPQAMYNDHQDTKLDVADNFPVVLIDGDASVLKQYLNAATNGGFDSMRKYQSANTSGGKMEIAIDRYLYDKDLKTFSKANANTYPATLVYHKSTGEFTTTAQYDNQQDTFTLVTVTMTGSSTSDKFVLHIPVIVRRMLQVDFMATMTSGTVFNKTDAFYSETRNHALASKGENITGYLTFHYNSELGSPATYDWQSYMEGGGDLLDYYKKTVDTGTNPLPAGTKITLIDCQNGDRRYYAEVTQATYLELFNGGKLTYKASDDTAFTPVTLSDLLEITATEATDEQKADDAVVKWVKLGNETGATVKALDEDSVAHYYRLYDASSDLGVTELYTLTVGNFSPTENYFVVISVPNAENHRLTLEKTGMAWSKSTTSPPLEVHQVHRYDPTKTDPKEGNSEASFNYLDNYQQSLVDNTDAGNVQVQATSAKVQIPISVTNTVSFTPANYNDSDPLYQELVIALKKTEENATTSVGLPSDAVAVTNTASSTTTENAVKLYAYYLDGSGQKQYYVLNGNSLVKSGTEKVPAISYAWSASANSAEMVLPFAVKTETGYQYIDLATLRKASGGKFFLEAETTLEMSMASVMTNNTIPYDAANGGTIENFTQIDAASILSFTESGLSYSTLKGNVAGNKKYYLNTERKAILKLDYTNIDQLGINLLEDQTAAIDTVLTLDFSNMEGFVSDVKQFKTLSEADTVQFTISLQKKGDSSYADASIGDYLSGARTSDGNSLSGYTITISKNGDGSYTYYNEQTGQFNIPISFSVKTEVREFANYRIRASVTLLKEGQNQNLDVDVTNAFITYTYAKINVDGYWD